MNRARRIQIYEYGWLHIGQKYNDVVFEERHFKALALYLTVNPSCGFYNLYYNKVRFLNYVGVIKIEDLTIEILPKTDKYTEDNKNLWQKVLIEMLLISLQVQAQTTNKASVHIRQHSVLETYLHTYLDEVQKLIHAGLVKKYRRHAGNLNTLKGKLLIHKQIVKNAVHAERFYTAHEIYDKNNTYNAILREALQCIAILQVSDGVTKRAQVLLIDFPECTPIKVSEKLFQRLRYDRKTEHYRTAIALARIILLSYHPDVRGGMNNILAIMFDMNYLWECFIYWSMKKATVNHDEIIWVLPQQKTMFWQHPDKWNLQLKPDIVIKLKDESRKVLDTKWKYQSDVSMEDIRQMYAYAKYFKASENYLLYPDNVNMVSKYPGFYYAPGSNAAPLSGKDEYDSCGTMFVNLLLIDEKGPRLNRGVGNEILKSLLGK